MTDAPDDRKQLSAADAREWLAQELRDLDKARELRIKEATELVNAFERGEIAAREVYRRMNAYEDRWGEALPGTSALPNMTDDEVLTRIDRANANDRARSHSNTLSHRYSRGAPDRGC
jgi:hypothetical protein